MEARNPNTVTRARGHHAAKRTFQTQPPHAPSAAASAVKSAVTLPKGSMASSTFITPPRGAFRAPNARPTAPPAASSSAPSRVEPCPKEEVKETPVPVKNAELPVEPIAKAADRETVRRDAPVAPLKNTAPNSIPTSANNTIAREPRIYTPHQPQQDGGSAVSEETHYPLAPVNGRYASPNAHVQNTASAPVEVAAGVHVQRPLQQSQPQPQPRLQQQQQQHQPMMVVAPAQTQSLHTHVNTASGVTTYNNRASPYAPAVQISDPNSAMCYNQEEYVSCPCPTCAYYRAYYAMQNSSSDDDSDSSSSCGSEACANQYQQSVPPSMGSTISTMSPLTNTFSGPYQSTQQRQLPPSSTPSTVSNVEYYTPNVQVGVGKYSSRAVQPAAPHWAPSTQAPMTSPSIVVGAMPVQQSGYTVGNTHPQQAYTNNDAYARKPTSSVVSTAPSVGNGAAPNRQKQSLPSPADAAQMFHCSYVGRVAEAACSLSGRGLLVAALRAEDPLVIAIVLEEVLAALEMVSLDVHGCFVVIALVEQMDPEQCMDFVSMLDETLILNLSTLSQNTRRIIQALFQRKDLDLGDVLAILASNAAYLTATQQGCISLMRVYELCDAESQAYIMQTLLSILPQVAQDRYGNYMIQCAMEKSEKATAGHYATTYFRGELLAMSCNKFSSNVIEKVIRCCGDIPAVRRLLVDELIYTPAALLTMVQDGFGNFVIQSIIDSTTNAVEYKRICQRLKAALPSSPYAGKIDMKLRSKRYLAATGESEHTNGYFQSRDVESNCAGVIVGNASVQAPL